MFTRCIYAIRTCFKRWTSNIERPTSNVEYWWRYALSILKQANLRISKGNSALPGLFFNWQNSLFDVGRSMFDVRCSFFQLFPHKINIALIGINPACKGRNVEKIAQFRYRKSHLTPNLNNGPRPKVRLPGFGMQSCNLLVYCPLSYFFLFKLQTAIFV